MKWFEILKWLVFCVFLAFPAYSAVPNQVVSDTEIGKARTQYGELAARRLSALKELIETNQSRPERLKLNLVNEFFSKVTFTEDSEVWKKKDFWATPAEFLAKDKGDAEDFAIAKYFSLIALGIDEKKIYFSYVTSTRLKKSHIVLTYFRSPKSEPLILDSLTDRILRASARSDLIPIYSFNGRDLNRGSQSASKKDFASSMHQWSQMLNRMQKGIVK